MNLLKWDPFRELEEVSSRLNRLFWRPQAQAGSCQEMLALVDWTPSVDISETDAAYLVKAEIPGVNKDNIHVTIDGNRVYISAEVKGEKKAKEGERVIRRERSYGMASRSFI